MPRNFIILFDEKEGSTPLVRLLDNFDAVSVLHLGDAQGWEPFDAHSCGELPLADFGRCLDLFYAPDAGRRDFDELSELYARRGRLPLELVDMANTRGFKMRLLPHERGAAWSAPFRRFRFKRTLFDRLAAHEVVVFVTFRQDVLRWALSLYHGDGTGRPGHLQFDLAERRVHEDAIPTMRVDTDGLGRVIHRCERTLAKKRALVARLRRRGLRAEPLLYERFCEDREGFFCDVMKSLELDASEAVVGEALQRGIPLRKVHSDDIHEFVDNADEVLERFGNRFERF